MSKDSVCRRSSAMAQDSQFDPQTISQLEEYLKWRFELDMQRQPEEMSLMEMQSQLEEMEKRLEEMMQMKKRLEEEMMNRIRSNVTGSHVPGSERIGGDSDMSVGVSSHSEPAMSMGDMSPPCSYSVPDHLADPEFLEGCDESQNKEYHVDLSRSWAPEKLPVADSSKTSS